MDNYISLEKLITEAGKKGVDFGKGDPYNRLRYYTKIGLLPHMVRKSVNGELVGHYPAYALDTLLEIEKLKSLGFKNEEIARKLKELSAGSSRSSGHTVRLARLLTPSAKTVKTALFVLFCLVILAGFGLLPVGKSKSDLIQKTLELDKRYISDSGNALMPRNQKKVYIKASSVKSDSRINITFTSDYSPATRYWVAQKTPFEGFYLELDAPTAMDADFSWWISN